MAIHSAMILRGDRTALEPCRSTQESMLAGQTILAPDRSQTARCTQREIVIQVQRVEWLRCEIREQWEENLAPKETKRRDVVTLDAEVPQTNQFLLKVVGEYLQSPFAAADHLLDVVV